MEINFIYANIGIDYWPSNRDYTYADTPLEEGIIKKIEQYDYLPIVTKVSFIGKSNPKTYQYTCSDFNKMFEQYNKIVFEKIKNFTNIDVLILSELCGQTIEAFDNFKSYYLQYYGPPGEYKRLLKSEEYASFIDKSKKYFLIGSLKDPIKIKPDPLFGFSNRYENEKIGTLLNLYFGCIQIAELEVNETKILIVNIHNRFYEAYEFLVSIIDILYRHKNYSNILIIGDFNYSKEGFMKFKDNYDTISRNDLNNFFTQMTFDVYDVDSIYEEYFQKCGYKKNINISLFYKFDKNLNINLTNLPCDYYSKTSSHPILNIKIKISQVTELKNKLDIYAYESFLSVLHGIICYGLAYILGNNKEKIKVLIEKIILLKKEFNNKIKLLEQRISGLNKKFSNIEETELTKFIESRILFSKNNLGYIEKPSIESITDIIFSLSNLKDEISNLNGLIMVLINSTNINKCNLPSNYNNNDFIISKRNYENYKNDIIIKDFMKNFVNFEISELFNFAVQIKQKESPRAIPRQSHIKENNPRKSYGVQEKGVYIPPRLRLKENKGGTKKKYRLID